MDQEAKEKQRLSIKAAKLKIEAYCAYQERSQQEVRDKLYDWGLYPDEVETLLADLIIDNFLNEERFAHAYVSGKFNLKAWGKLKIKQGLKQKRVPSRLIEQALQTIDPELYERSLLTILKKKAILSTEKDDFKRKQKLIQHALLKGYESDLIFELLNHNKL